MSPPVCARCALGLIRAPILNKPLVRRTVRCISTLQPHGYEPLPSIPTLPSQLPSLDALPDAPFNTITVPTTFIQSTSPEVVPLLEAISRNDDREIWRVYTWLSSTKNKNLKRSHFTQIIRALHPKRFFYNVQSKNRQIFIKSIERIKSDMKTRGYVLTHSEWAHILDCCRALRKPRQARKWWREMIESGVVPDVWSYNNYLASISRANRHLQFERPLRFKVNEEGNLVNLGKWIARGPKRIQRWPLEDMSQRASDIVREMLEKDIAPNAYTYELLITAYARDNSLDPINDIIAGIWGLNPDGTSTNMSAGAHRKGSPLWPSEHTLNVLANAYGYNGAVASAIALVEGMSRKYEIPVPVSAWISLLMWTSRRSTIYRRPKLGFISPLAAPRLFNIMTSEFNISPGIEAYWLIINHETKRLSRGGSTERYLIDILKRYGPNGTDLTFSTKHLANRVLAGVKNWVPILCDRLSRSGNRDRAVAIFRRFQHRFHQLETTGLLREWDEIEPARKSSIPGVILPSTSSHEKSLQHTLRTALAKSSARRRSRTYKTISQNRRLHYPPRWKGPGRPLFVPFGMNIQYGLGAPRHRYRHSHHLWQMHVQGTFRESASRRDNKVIQVIEPEPQFPDSAESSVNDPPIETPIYSKTKGRLSREVLARRRRQLHAERIKTQLNAFKSQQAMARLPAFESSVRISMRRRKVRLTRKIREFKRSRTRKLKARGTKNLSEIEERLRDSGYGKYKGKYLVGLTEKMKPFLSSKKDNE